MTAILVEPVSEFDEALLHLDTVVFKHGSPVDVHYTKIVPAVQSRHFAELLSQLLHCVHGGKTLCYVSKYFHAIKYRETVVEFQIVAIFQTKEEAIHY
jgi:hypothetical protein